MNNSDWSGDMIEFQLINSVLKDKQVTKTVDGVKTKVFIKVIDKEFNSRKLILRNAITSVEEYVSQDQVINHDRAVIYDKYTSEHYCVNHSVEDIKTRLLNKSTNKIGFNGKIF